MGLTPLNWIESTTQEHFNKNQLVSYRKHIHHPPVCSDPCPSPINGFIPTGDAGPELDLRRIENSDLQRLNGLFKHTSRGMDLSQGPLLLQPGALS